MSDDSTRPIIIKRKKVIAGGAHGGAWKIAYADFVTAMMAFFLLMWLLGSTAKGDLAGIADYFQNPLKVSMAGGSGSGDATSVLQGGGKDLTRQTGQVKRGDVQAKKSTSFSKEALNWPSSRNKCCSILLRKVCAYKLLMNRTGQCLTPVVQTSSLTLEKFCARSASH